MASIDWLSLPREIRKGNPQRTNCIIGEPSLSFQIIDGNS
jgi:hypothetical protein